MRTSDTVDHRNENMRIGTSVMQDEDEHKYGKTGPSPGRKSNGGVLADRIARFRSAPPRPRPERTRSLLDAPATASSKDSFPSTVVLRGQGYNTQQPSHPPPLRANAAENGVHQVVERELRPKAEKESPTSPFRSRRLSPPRKGGADGAIAALRQLAARNPRLHQALVGLGQARIGAISSSTLTKVRSAIQPPHPINDPHASDPHCTDTSDSRAPPTLGHGPNPLLEPSCPPSGLPLPVADTVQPVNSPAGIPVPMTDTVHSVNSTTLNPEHPPLSPPTVQHVHSAMQTSARLSSAPVVPGLPPVGPPEPGHQTSLPPAMRHRATDPSEVELLSSASPTVAETSSAPGPQGETPVQAHDVRDGPERGAEGIGWDDGGTDSHTLSARDNGNCDGARDNRNHDGAGEGPSLPAYTQGTRPLPPKWPDELAGDNIQVISSAGQPCPLPPKWPDELAGDHMQEVPSAGPSCALFGAHPHSHIAPPDRGPAPATALLKPPDEFDVNHESAGEGDARRAASSRHGPPRGKIGRGSGSGRKSGSPGLSSDGDERGSSFQHGPPRRQSERGVASGRKDSSPGSSSGGDGRAPRRRVERGVASGRKNSSPGSSSDGDGRAPRRRVERGVGSGRKNSSPGSSSDGHGRAPLPWRLRSESATPSRAEMADLRRRFDVSDSSGEEGGALLYALRGCHDRQTEERHPHESADSQWGGSRERQRPERHPYASADSQWGACHDRQRTPAGTPERLPHASAEPRRGEEGQRAGGGTPERHHDASADSQLAAKGQRMGADTAERHPHASAQPQRGGGGPPQQRAFPQGASPGGSGKRSSPVPGYAAPRARGTAGRGEASPHRTRLMRAAPDYYSSGSDDDAQANHRVRRAVPENENTIILQPRERKIPEGAERAGTEAGMAKGHDGADEQQFTSGTSQFTSGTSHPTSGTSHPTCDVHADATHSESLDAADAHLNINHNNSNDNNPQSSNINNPGNHQSASCELPGGPARLRSPGGINNNNNNYYTFPVQRLGGIGHAEKHGGGYENTGTKETCARSITPPCTLTNRACSPLQIVEATVLSPSPPSAPPSPTGARPRIATQPPPSPARNPADSPPAPLASAQGHAPGGKRQTPALGSNSTPAKRNVGGVSSHDARASEADTGVTHAGADATGGNARGAFLPPGEWPGSGVTLGELVAAYAGRLSAPAAPAGRETPGDVHHVAQSACENGPSVDSLPAPSTSSPTRPAPRHGGVKRAQSRCSGPSLAERRDEGLRQARGEPGMVFARDYSGAGVDQCDSSGGTGGTGSPQYVWRPGLTGEGVAQAARQVTREVDSILRKYLARTQHQASASHPTASTDPGRKYAPDASHTPQRPRQRRLPTLLSGAGEMGPVSEHAYQCRPLTPSTPSFSPPDLPPAASPSPPYASQYPSPDRRAPQWAHPAHAELPFAVPHHSAHAHADQRAQPAHAQAPFAFPHPPAHAHADPVRRRTPSHWLRNTPPDPIQSPWPAHGAHAMTHDVPQYANCGTQPDRHGASPSAQWMDPLWAPDRQAGGPEEYAQQQGGVRGSRWGDVDAREQGVRHNAAAISAGWGEHDAGGGLGDAPDWSAASDRPPWAQRTHTIPATNRNASNSGWPPGAAQTPRVGPWGDDRDISPPPYGDRWDAPMGRASRAGGENGDRWDALMGRASRAGGENSVQPPWPFRGGVRLPPAADGSVRREVDARSPPQRSWAPRPAEVWVRPEADDRTPLSSPAWAPPPPARGGDARVASDPSFGLWGAAGGGGPTRPPSAARPPPRRAPSRDPSVYGTPHPPTPRAVDGGPDLPVNSFHPQDRRYLPRQSPLPPSDDLYVGDEAFRHPCGAGDWPNGPPHESAGRFAGRRAVAPAGDAAEGHAGATAGPPSHLGHYATPSHSEHRLTPSHLEHHPTPSHLGHYPTPSHASGRLRPRVPRALLTGGRMGKPPPRVRTAGRRPQTINIYVGTSAAVPMDNGAPASTADVKDSRPSTALTHNAPPPATTLGSRPFPPNPVHEPLTATSMPGEDVTAAPAIATATPRIDVTAEPNPTPSGPEPTHLPERHSPPICHVVSAGGTAINAALTVSGDADAGGVVGGAASSGGAQAAAAQALEQLARAGLRIHLHHHRAADPTAA